MINFSLLRIIRSQKSGDLAKIATSRYSSKTLSQSTFPVFLLSCSFAELDTEPLAPPLVFRIAPLLKVCPVIVILPLRLLNDA